MKTSLLFKRPVKIFKVVANLRLFLAGFFFLNQILKVVSEVVSCYTDYFKSLLSKNLNFISLLSGWADSNCRPHAPQTCDSYCLSSTIKGF